ncbi:unnamed protein product, partial [Symbiodinium pilosum]
EFFTTDLAGKMPSPSSGLPLATWLEGLPVLAGQSISGQCKDCGPLLSIKRFTAPAASTTRLRQPQHEASKAEDLPQERASPDQLPSIRVEPPSLQPPWWSNLYYATLLLTAGALSLGAVQEWRGGSAGCQSDSPMNHNPDEVTSAVAYAPAG